MPTLADHSSTSIIKLLAVGENGTGKSGALASLAKAGYRLWILDYDNGLDSIVDALSGDTDALKRVTFETLRDDITTVNGLPKIKTPVHAYEDAGRTIQKWEKSLPEYEIVTQEFLEEDKPPVISKTTHHFTPSDVLVLDTLSSFTQAAFNKALALGARLNQRPQLQDYGWMADSVKLFIEMLTSPDLNCHVIVNTHIRFLTSEADETTQRGLPNAKGQEISREVGKYFNNVILFRTLGSGPGARRRIGTQPQGVVEVKVSAPSKVKAEYPIDTGLADLFADILGHRGPIPPTTNQAKG